MTASEPKKAGYFWAQVERDGTCEIIEVVEDFLGLKVRRFGVPGFYSMEDIAFWGHPIPKQHPTSFDPESQY